MAANPSGFEAARGIGYWIGRAVILFAIQFAGLASVGMPAWAGQPWAIVIGVNDCPDYELPNGGRSTPLQGAENDARELATLLKKSQWPSERTFLLLGAEAKFAAVRDCMLQTLRQRQPGELLLLYFAGHGTQMPDAVPLDEDDDLDECLCLADARPDGSGLLRDDQLARWLELGAQGPVVVILDCCHSGTATKGDDDFVPRFLPGPRTMPAIDRRPGQPSQPAWKELKPIGKDSGAEVTTLFACRAEEQAYERRPPGGKSTSRVGQFSYWLLESLRSAAAAETTPEQPSPRAIIEFVSRQLESTYNRFRSNPAEQQHPWFDSVQPDKPLLPP